VIPKSEWKMQKVASKMRFLPAFWCLLFRYLGEFKIFENFFANTHQTVTNTHQVFMQRSHGYNCDHNHNIKSLDI
jgi:hypothetical protein